MDRRDFLGRLTAAAAAFTAAVGGGGLARAATPPTAAAPARLRKLPGVAITADTSRFEKSIGDAGRRVVDLLRECRVTTSGWTKKPGDLERYRVTFVQTSDGAPMSELDREAWSVIERGYLTEIWMTAESGEIDVTHIGDPHLAHVDLPAKERHTVTAEFIVRS